MNCSKYFAIPSSSMLPITISAAPFALAIAFPIATPVPRSFSLPMSGVSSPNAVKSSNAMRYALQTLRILFSFVASYSTDSYRSPVFCLNCGQNDTKQDILYLKICPCLFQYRKALIQTATKHYLDKHGALCSRVMCAFGTNLLKM